MSPGLDAALQRVDYEAYIGEGAALVPQSSSRDVVAHLLEALAVAPGMRVLEVGTGSGYGTALLSHLVGEGGRVFSVDVSPAITARARARLQADGRTNAALATADARRTIPDPGPFDRLVAWATAEAIPGAWPAVLAGDGRLVAPVQVQPLDGAAPVACVDLREGGPQAVRFTWGSFGPLLDAGEAADPARLANRRGDVRRPEAAGTAWLSAPWLRAGSTNVRRRVEGMLGALRPGPELLQPPERPEDLWWFLVATAARGLTAAGLPTFGPAFGHGGPDGLALIPRAGGRGWVAGNAMRSVLQLQAWVRAWQAQGRPGLDALAGACRWDARGECWRVEAALRG